MIRLSAISSRSFVYFSLCTVFFSVAAVAAPAKTDDDDPNINIHGTGVNRILEVLRRSPDSASESCLHSLSEMHKAQKQLEDIETRDEDPDTGLVRDVLASDMEDVITMCGADAHRVCREKSGDDGTLSKRCEVLPDDLSSDPE